MHDTKGNQEKKRIVDEEFEGKVEIYSSAKELGRYIYVMYEKGWLNQFLLLLPRLYKYVYQTRFYVLDDYALRGE